MIKGKTESGFSFEIEEEELDDIELLELLADVGTNPLLIPKIVAKILGPDQKKALYDHVRDKNGRASTTKVSEEFAEILASTKQLKNS